ncbi:peroxiredoxin Q, chloroplastic isoform X2 [Lotus japonicus]|uniref:peroxiredoxin Q, chloroplastic isoform X2 n=1 Tax=Lotus japonicus TaxID=34305 RepID=UPI0025881DA6|nr:peroxiredoxin Q, chloroplastic isoform X2 [Lotus japonicus]
MFCYSSPSMAKASSLTLPNPNHSLPIFIHSPSSSNLPFPFPQSSSNSQFIGLKLSSTHSSSCSVPSSSFKGSIVAKVSKGSKPPAFTLRDQDGKTVSLTKFKGKPVVVYFYPADETPGCTKQACAFRDSYEKFKKAGAEVVGISGDDSSSHKAFAKKYRLPFTLLSDEGNKVRKEWGVPGDFFGALPGRETYVLDKSGVVQLVYNNQFQPEKHIDETLKLLQSL